MRTRGLIALLVLLALLVVPNGLAFAEEAPVEFTDTKGHWASESIVVCKTYQLINGYPGNLFKPKQAMTRAEALVVINRGMGWEKQAETVNTAGIKFPADLWKGFQGNIAVAADKQLIYKESIPNIKFNVPATRLEVALWISHALNLNGDAADLTFKDLDKIPANYQTDTYKNMLAGVVQSGIITGLPGNLFEPNKPFTRAEMAAILGRMLDHGWVSPPVGSHVIGKLVLADAAQKKVTVQTASGTKTYELAGAYMAFRSGAKANLDTLKAGENVKISLNSTGKCVFIAYYSGNVPATNPGSQPTASKTYTGTVKSLIGGFLIFQPDTGPTVALSISPTVEVTVSGGSSTLSSVIAGAKGTITVTDDKVAKIALTSGAAPTSSGDKGYIVNKYWDYFTVRLANGTVEDVQLSGVSFISNGAGSTYADMLKGANVELLKTGSTVTSVRILDGARKVFGEVTQVGSQSITIEDDDDRSASYDLDEDADIRYNDGDRADVDDIDEGMYIELTLNSNDDVTAVKMDEDSDSSSLTGEVTYISSSKIELDDDDMYYFADSVTYKDEDGDSCSRSDIEEGMEVKLTLNGDDEVTRVEIKDSNASSSTADGEVTYISSSKIELDDDDMYYFADSVTYKDEDGDTISRSDIEEGMEVELTLNSDDEVTRVEITDSNSTTVRGEVTYISSTKIELDDDDVYYFAESVTYKDEDGDSISRSDIDKGTDVELTLNSDDEITRVDIV